MDAQFSIGQLVHHRFFDYRGVIYDVDPSFQGTEEWYETMAKSKPPKNRPWYRVLVHGSVHETYVAERNLEPDDTSEPINHPLVDTLFDSFHDGAYHIHRSVN
jgi:heat shock protein HspQ